MAGKNRETSLRNLKGGFPFRLSTTSFIFPAGWVENVARLGPCFDEIELLFFESRHAQSLPDPGIMKQLALQAAELNIGYNIHLPIDIRLGSPSAEKRRHAVEVLKKVFALSADLPVTTHTLHLVYDAPGHDPSSVDRWRDNIHGSLTRLLQWGVPSTALSIENIDYPLGRVESVITDLGLTACLDIGHLLLYGHGLRTTLCRWSQQTAIVHLHGVHNGRDHLSIECLSEKAIREVMAFLSTFSGVLSLEVFNLEDLKRSMDCLARCWSSRQT